MRSIDRRRFLQGAAAGGILLAGRKPAFSAAMAHAMAPARATPGFNPDIELDLNAVVDEIRVLSGEPTRAWRFTGRVVRGAAHALGFLDGSRHIPVIRVRRGQKLRINFTNRLPEDSIVHWHGLHIVQRMDGHPMYAIGPGKKFVYEFLVDNRAGTYWFHPHPHGRTGYQVYHGLAGLFLIGDDEEDAARLPGGEFDLPLVIQDRTLDARNQLVYLGGGMRDRMMGFAGQRVLVNGAAEYRRTVMRTAHRLRLFNGSNSTLYRLRWSNGDPFTVIGTDGGLLERPLTREYLTLAVAERIDVWVDFSGRQPGEELALLAGSYSPMLDNITSGQSGAQVLPGGRPIARFRIAGGAARKSVLPERLSSFPALRLDEAFNRDLPRSFELSMMRGQAMLNGRAFDRMDEVAADETVKLGSTEVWEFANNAPFGMRMAHPIHIHNLQFRILERIRTERPGGVQLDLSAGFTDDGMKDVVLVMPGERVRVLMKFENYTGLYLYHCHILEHEDLGMMRNYLVEAPV
jgi:FtsP/CotA-like multicopper oxidase with cupredoxin domain